VSNPFFLAVFLPGDQTQTRLGITVTKKIGGAVTRNRIKRLTREFFRRSQHELNGVWDINIIARKESTGLSTRETFEALRNLFERIGR
jgi:ribonuclease P protein component